VPYTVYLKRSAEKELAELPAKTHDRIIKVLLSLKDDPFRRNAKKLHGREAMRRSGTLFPSVICLVGRQPCAGIAK
jgi:mRNA-degrading endonuclease RelE of RelBE toxin-antitoxin system